MSLFNQILDAVNNPEQEASTSQLGGIIDTVQQLASNSNTNSSDIRSAMSVVGSFTRSALQQQRSNGRINQANQLINQFGGTRASTQAVQTLFSGPQLQQMIQQINQKTGLDARAIQGLLPILVPLVLNLLKTGNRRTNSAVHTTNSAAGNSVLDSFLDADGDGDVDVADAMIMAQRHLGK